MARLSEWRIAVGLMVHFAVLVHYAHFARAQPGSLLRTTQFLGDVMCLAHDMTQSVGLNQDIAVWLQVR
jgi:hypothetical protein